MFEADFDMKDDRSLRQRIPVGLIIYGAAYYCKRGTCYRISVRLSLFVTHVSPVKVADAWSV